MTDHGFAPLDRELQKCAEAGLVLPIWWRDDDATDPSPALDRLSNLAKAVQVPVHLGVIPEPATWALAQNVGPDPWLVPVQHGWRHKSHAPVGSKKAEFGDHRPLDEMMAEITRGSAPYAVPVRRSIHPHVCAALENRISPDLAPHLAAAGFSVLSTFTPRPAERAAPDLVQINTHLDPIHWRGGGGLVDPDVLIEQMVRQLQDRRLGLADNREPYGLLTHHLVHDDAIWHWIEALLDRLMAGPVSVWTMPAKGEPL